MPGARQNHKFRWVAICAAAGKTPPAPTIFQKTPEETTIRKSPLPEANSSKIPYIITTDKHISSRARIIRYFRQRHATPEKIIQREQSNEAAELPGKCAKVSMMSGKLKPELYRPERS